MCKFFSCLVTKDLKVLWNKDIASHEDLVRKFNIKDDKLENREFVRIEISQKDTKIFTKNTSDWQFNVDEKGTLPAWFNKDKKFLETECWNAWKQAMKPFTGLKKVNEFLASIKKVKFFICKTY